MSTKGKKSKRPLSTTLGKAASPPEDDKEKPSDLGILGKPIHTSLFGLQEILNMFQTGSEEVRSYARFECDILYECRICRNIFRSFANFVLHKRNYCRENFYHQSNSEDNNYQIICADILSTSREGTPQPLGRGDKEKSPVAQENANVATRRSQRRLNNSLLQEEVNEITHFSLTEDISGEISNYEVNGKPNCIAIESIPSSKAGVFQTLFEIKSNEQITNDLMKNEVMELHGLIDSDEAVLSSDGSIDMVQTRKLNERTSIPPTDLTCTICNQVFSTKKTLSYHIKYKHNGSKIVYPCPECKDTFANAWCVFRHLYKIHRKTAVQIKKLRDQIHASGIRKEDEPVRKKPKERCMNGLNENNIIQQNKQWIEDFEGSNDLQMCGGCGKRFERKAALHSHSQMCMKRMAVCSNSMKETAKKAILETKTEKIKSQQQQENNNEEEVLIRTEKAGSSRRKPKYVYRHITTKLPIEEEEEETEEVEEKINNKAIKEEKVDKQDKRKNKNLKPEEIKTKNSNIKIKDEEEEEEEEDQVFIYEEVIKEEPVVIVIDEDEIQENVNKNEQEEASEKVEEKEKVANVEEEKEKVANVEEEKEKVANVKKEKEKVANVEEEEKEKDIKHNLHYQNEEEEEEECEKMQQIDISSIAEIIGVKRSDNVKIELENRIEEEMYTNSCKFTSCKEVKEEIINNIDDINSKKEEEIGEILVEKNNVGINVNKSRPTSPCLIKSPEIKIADLENKEEEEEEEYIICSINNTAVEVEEENEVKPVLNKQFTNNKDFSDVSNEEFHGFELLTQAQQKTTDLYSENLQKNNKSDKRIQIFQSCLGEGEGEDEGEGEGEDEGEGEGENKDEEDRGKDKDVIDDEIMQEEKEKYYEEGLVRFNGLSITTKRKIEVFSNPKPNLHTKKVKIDVQNQIQTTKSCCDNSSLIGGGGVVEDEGDKNEVTLEMKASEYIDLGKSMCLSCKLKFATHEQLMKHMSYHFKWFMYQCSKCLFMSYDKTTCKVHAKRQHNSQSFENIVLPIPNWKTVNISSDFIMIRQPIYESSGVVYNPEIDLEIPKETQEINNPTSSPVKKEKMRNMIMEVIFGSNESEKMPSVSLQSHSSSQNPPVVLNTSKPSTVVNLVERGPRPCRNRSKPINSDFVYDMTQILRPKYKTESNKHLPIVKLKKIQNLIQNNSVNNKEYKSISSAPPSVKTYEKFKIKSGNDKDSSLDSNKTNLKSDNKVIKEIIIDTSVEAVLEVPPKQAA